MTHQFTVYGKPVPQGSSSAYIRGGRAIVTSDNKKLKPWRQTVTEVLLAELNERGLTAPLYGKHVPVLIGYQFTFLRPAGAPKSRSSILLCCRTSIRFCGA